MSRQVIQAIHRAGGCKFLEHSLAACSGIEEQEPWLVELKALGLDGIEALNSDYPESVREQLVAAASQAWPADMLGNRFSWV